MLSICVSNLSASYIVLLSVLVFLKLSYHRLRSIYCPLLQLARRHVRPAIGACSVHFFGLIVGETGFEERSDSPLAQTAVGESQTLFRSNVYFHFQDLVANPWLSLHLVDTMFCCESYENPIYKIRNSLLESYGTMLFVNSE